MSQEIKTIKVKDLVLWTENPRDPIKSDAKDQDIADKALTDNHGKWNLMKLAKEMKTHYDFSELPTIVYHGGKPVVYDGNRRIILAKLKHDFVSLEDVDKSNLPDIPKELPCNVCSKDIAVLNIYRKHADSGSWSPLDRDIFIHKYMGKPKSIFLKLDEETGLISSNPHMNQGFVKKEIFTEDKLKDLGFGFEDDALVSRHGKTEALAILQDISAKVSSKKITTRSNRGKVLEVLEKSNRTCIAKNGKKPLKKVTVKAGSILIEPKKRKSPRTQKKSPELFDGTLYLKSGQVSDLYRDITDLYNYYLQNKTLSQYFPSLIRMSLRLLCEAASSDLGVKMDDYIKDNFEAGKRKLSKDAKTTMSTQNVNKGSIVQLLHIGAHNYKAANNMDQTIAVSIILGAMLSISHEK